MSKLSYKIIGRRPLGEAAGLMGPNMATASPEAITPLEAVDVEWTHADGPVTDTIMVPVTHPPDIKYEKREAGTRDIIKDQINVRPGTPDSIVMQILEEKRQRLAECLGVEA